MTRLWTLWLLSTLFFSALNGLPYGDDNNDIYSNDEYEDDDKSPSGNTNDKVITRVPIFSTKTENFLVNEGETIRLPCLVDRLEGFVLLWKKNDEFLTVNSQILSKDSRLQVEQSDNGNYLLIPLAEESDAGNYTCQISAYKPSEISHNVKIRVRPEVKPVPESGLIVTKTGSTVTLGCQVIKGSPAPEVKWHRRERKMPSGEAEIRGLSLTYTAVTRHHSGIYVCSADNGFGEPSETVLKLDVQHAPEIEQEETFIHTGEGDETEVICIVHSSPKAHVVWLKDGFPVDPVKTRVDQRGNRHTLTIPSITEDSFGDYTCEAENEFGKDRKTARVSGKAAEAQFKSDPKGSHWDHYQLEWTARSATPITHFKVAYRPETGIMWREAEVRAVNLDREIYAGDFRIPELQSATVYLAKVASKNSYGYNDFSEEFKFATKGADPVQKPITGGSQSNKIGGSASLVIAAAILAIIQISAKAKAIF